MQKNSKNVKKSSKTQCPKSATALNIAPNSSFSVIAHVRVRIFFSGLSARSFQFYSGKNLFYKMT